MTTPRSVSRSRTPRLLLALPLAFAALPLAALPLGARAADCVPPGGEDVNGDGYLDAFVSPRALIVDSELDCDSRVGARSLIYRATLTDASVGERSVVGPGSNLEAEVTIGSRTILVADVEVIGGFDAVSVGDRVFVGRGVRLESGASPFTVIGDGAIIRRDARIVGGEYAENLRVGPRTTLEDVFTGPGVVIGSDVSIGFKSMLGGGTRIGDGVAIAMVSELGDGVVVRRDAAIGEFVAIGDGSVVGRGATIGDEATLGEGVRVGAGATVADGAEVPAFTEIAPGTTYP